MTALAVLVTAGCAAPSDPPATEAAPVETPAPTPEPAPEPEPASIELPTTCDDLFSIDVVREHTDPRVDPMDLWDDIGEHGFGPVAVSAYKGAEQSIRCEYGINATDAFSQVIVSELTPEVREHFMAELENARFERRTEGPEKIFELQPEPGKPFTPLDYTFIGDVWVATHNSVGSLMDPAVARVLELNPHLAE